MSNGYGHLYMNQIKNIFSVCKNIEELARDVLHFQMPNALNHFFRCSDCHKSYQALGDTYLMVKHMNCFTVMLSNVIQSLQWKDFFRLIPTKYTI